MSSWAIVMLSSGSFTSGTYWRTGASRSSLPSAASRMITVEVNVFETEPMRNSVSSSTGRGLSRLVTPWEAYDASPLAQMPTATPGISNCCAVAETNSVRVFGVVIPKMLQG